MVETQLCKLRGTSDIYTNYRSRVFNVFESVPKESGRSLSAYDHAVTVSLCG